MKKKCYECGKEISFWNSRFHPVLGKNQRVCPECFTSLEASLEKYRDFVLNDLEHGELKKVTEFINTSLVFTL